MKRTARLPVGVDTQQTRDLLWRLVEHSEQRTAELRDLIIRAWQEEVENNPVRARSLIIAANTTSRELHDRVATVLFELDVLPDLPAKPTKGAA